MEEGGVRPERSSGTEEGATASDFSRLLVALAQGDHSEAPPVPRPGDEVGRFRILRSLGKGGFGLVYEAEDPTLGRSVALKVVRPGSLAAEDGEHVRREAEAVARLSHPNVVTVHELGASRFGPYLVMELLRGETLEERLARGPLPLESVEEIAEAMARGLAHAHGAGVAHRDLKPANVFLAEDGSVKILDFGLAFVRGRGGDRGGGTPAYMSPEQWRGEQAGPPADVFALGAVLFRMLTGLAPYRMVGGVSTVLSPGSTPRLPPATAPRALRKLTADCLEREVHRRPSNGAALLERLLSARRDAERRGRRRRARVLAAAFVLALATLGLTFLLRPRAPRPGGSAGTITVVVADLENGTGDPQLDRLSGLLVTSLEQSHALAVVTRASIVDKLLDLGHRVSDRIDEGVGRDLARRTGASLLLVGSVARFDETYSIDLRGLDPGSDRYLFTLREKAVGKSAIPDLLDRLSDRVRGALAESPVEVQASRVRLAEAVTGNLEAYRHFFDGRQLSAEGRHGQALAEYRRAVAIEPTFAVAHLEIALMLINNDVGGARSALEKAERHGAAAPERDRLIIRAVAAAYWERIDEAIQLYEDAQRRFPNDAEAFVRCAGLVRNYKGDDARAIELLRRAAALEPGRTPYLVQALILDRRLEEAGQLAARFAARNPGPESLRSLALVRAQRGEVEQELEAASRAVAAGVPLEDVLLHGYLRGGALEEAEAVLRKTIASPELPAYDRKTAYVNLATLRGYQGRWREALQVIDQATRELDGGQRSLQLLWNRTFLAGGVGVAAVRSGTEELLRGGHDWFTCASAILAYAGDPGRAEEVLEQATPALRASPCARIAEGVISWRRGNVALGIERIQGMNFGTEQLYLGAMLLEAGRPVEALEALQRFDRQTIGWLSFYAWGAGEAAWLRARALERLGRRAEARSTVEAQLRVWAHADAGDPALRRMRALGARLRAGPP